MFSQVDRLQLELEHQRVYHQKLLAENESRERRIREEGDERVGGASNKMADISNKLNVTSNDIKSNQKCLFKQSKQIRCTY